MSDPFSRRGFTRAALGAAALWAMPAPLRAQERPRIDLEVVLTQRRPRRPWDLIVALRIRPSRRVELPRGTLALRAKLIHGRETPITFVRDAIPDNIQARYSPGIERYRAFDAGALTELDAFIGRWPDGVDEGILQVRIAAQRSTLAPLGPAGALLGRELSLAVTRAPA